MGTLRLAIDYDKNPFTLFTTERLALLPASAKQLQLVACKISFM